MYVYCPLTDPIFFFALILKFFYDKKLFLLEILFNFVKLSKFSEGIFFQIGYLVEASICLDKIGCLRQLKNTCCNKYNCTKKQKKKTTYLP